MTTMNGVMLSSGRRVHEYLMPNGATLAEVGGGEMTEAEYTEYVAYIRGLTLQQQRARLAAREEMAR